MFADGEEKEEGRGVDGIMWEFRAWKWDYYVISPEVR